MSETASFFVSPWSNYYVMTGAAAGSLTGLMFVVITLVTGTERIRKSPDGIGAFSTPTVAHFGAALLVSAILTAPWKLLIHPAIFLGIVGLGGLAYVLRGAFRARGLESYQPDVEDWIWYTLLPLAAYGAILAGAIMVALRPVDAMFAFAGGVLLLIFIGIRNAWDIVTFIVTSDSRQPPESD